MRGNKIWSIALLLSLALSMFAIVVRPAPAQATTSVIAPTIVNPLMVPGGTFAIDILVNNVVDMWDFDFVLNYDTNILTATSVLVNVLDPVAAYGFKVTTIADIDDSLGTVHVAANRGPSGNIVGEFVGTGDGVNKIFFLDNPRILSAGTTTMFVNGVSKPFALTTSSGRIAMTTAPAAGAVVTANYNHPGLTVDAQFPMCTIAFSVDARGVSPLDLQGTTSQDIYFNPIALEEVDGSFDNRFEGHLAAPLYKNVALKPGDEFDVVITAENVLYPTWGVSFFLDYDTNVLEGPTYVQVQDLNIVTEDPVPLATVHFKLKAEGWTVLHIRDITAVSVYGDALYFDSTDGSFASITPIDLTKRGAWPNTMIPMYGSIDMLHAQVVTTATGADVLFQVVFSIYDVKGGFLLGTIETAPATMPQSTTMEVTAPFDTSVWGVPKYYWFIGFYMVKVRAQVTYDSNGDGIMDSFGSRVKDFYILVLAFK